MLKRPRFKAHFTVKIVEGEGVLILSEKSYFVFPGTLNELVISCIDGSHSSVEIVELLAGKVSAQEVKNTILELEKQGLLTEADDSIPDNEAAFWWMQGLHPKTALQRLKENPVSVHAFGTISLDRFVETLESFHVRITNESKFAVAFADDYLSSELSEFNEQSLNKDRSWMLVKPVGTELWFGPIFVPGRTGCWECLAHRLRLHNQAETFLRNKKLSFEPASRSFTPATLNVAWNLAATKVVRWIAHQELPELEGKIVTHNMTNGETGSHTLVWRPQCPVCGDFLIDGAQDVQPIVLRSTRKNFMLDGGHRVTVPEATLEKYQHHISPITGVTDKLNPYSVSKAGAFHVYGGSVNCVSTQNGLGSIGNIMTSSGKGATDIQARTSALCESLERFSGIFHGDEPRRKARFKDLGEAAIHPYAYMLYSEKQYSNRAAWNAKSNSKMFVPQPFNEDDEMEWSPVWSLTRNATRFLPTAYCYYSYPVQPPAICPANSNGNAAGNTLEEAILQGFLELIERDSVAIWWFNRIQKPLVDWTSFGLSYLEDVGKYHQDLGRELWVLDITSDLQVPAFVSISRCTDGPEERIVAGFGAHLDAKIAILRAVTELNQAIVWTAKNHPFPAELYESMDADVSLNTVTARDLPHVLPDTNKKARVARDYPRLWTDDLKEDVLILKTIVEKEGMEMLVLDQTRADIGLPVVKVIIPELRHFWPRFAPGRLYDVPVKLGWLSGPLSEEQLNPIMIFV